MAKRKPSYEKKSQGFKKRYLVLAVLLLILGVFFSLALKDAPPPQQSVVMEIPLTINDQ